MAPVEHVAELCRILHVSLQCGQEDLRGVAEDDNAQGDGKGGPVQVEGHLKWQNHDEL